MIILLLLMLTQIETKAYLAKEYVNKKLTIGDPFEILVVIEAPVNKKISQVFADSIEPFVILDQKRKIVQEKGKVIDTYHFKVAAFNTGELTLPPFKFTVGEGTTLDTIQTNTIEVKVQSLLSEDMKDINDIKPMIEFPNLLPFILMIVVILLAIVLFFGFRLYRRIKRRIASPEKLIPCWEKALNALDALLKEEIVDGRTLKKFYYALTEILKRYLEERFGFPAIEQTTTEIIQSMKLQKIPLRDDFQTVFTYADMVKYAKFIPPQNATENLVKQVRELIHKTIPGPVQGTEK